MCTHAHNNKELAHFPDAGNHPDVASERTEN